MSWHHGRKNEHLDKNVFIIDDNTRTDQDVGNSEQFTACNEMSINGNFDQKVLNHTTKAVDLGKELSKQSQLPSRRRTPSSCNSGRTSDTSSSGTSGSSYSLSTSTSTSSSYSSSSSNTFLTTRSKLARVENNSAPDKPNSISPSVERAKPHSPTDSKGSIHQNQISSQMNNVTQIHNQSDDICSDDNRTSQTTSHGPVSVLLIDGNFRYS